MGLFSKFLFVVAYRREFACWQRRAGPPPAPRAFAQGMTNGPDLNSARGGGAMLRMPPRGISR
jgi:hypothetical protein